jgi:hypothetical protein
VRARSDEVGFLYISAQHGHLEVVKALLQAGVRELAMMTREGRWSQLPLHQCGEWASGGGECAARGARAGGGRGARRAGRSVVPERRRVFERDQDSQAWLNLQHLGTQVRIKTGLLLSTQ